MLGRAENWRTESLENPLAFALKPKNLPIPMEREREREGGEGNEKLPMTTFSLLYLSDLEFPVPEFSSTGFFITILI